MRQPQHLHHQERLAVVRPERAERRVELRADDGVGDASGALGPGLLVDDGIVLLARRVDRAVPG